MISLVKKYLDINRYSKAKETFEDLYQSHPNYPSLFAVTDSLDSLTIENVAAKVTKEHFQELPTHFLANFKDEIVLVNKTNQLIDIEKSNGDKLSLPTNEFLTDWDGIILVIEPNDKENEEKKNESLNNPFGFILCVCFILVLSSILYFGFNFRALFYLSTSILGIVASVLIVQEKFGIHNETVSKICNGFNTSCNSVITSETGKINKWISFSDLPLVFFATNFLSLLLSPFESIYIIGLLSVFSIPVLIYSIWMQNRVVKKWCPICLFVSLVIVFQAIEFLYFFHEEITMSSIYAVYYYAFSWVVVLLFWMALKPLIENKINTKKTINTLIRFKRNVEIFNFLSKEVIDIKTFNSLEGITLGNSNANLKVTLFLSPSCGHCHTAFQEAYNLANNFPEKVSVQILFNINPDNQNNQYLEIVQNLLELNKEKNSQVLEAIKDWHLQKMTLEKWLQKWQVNSTSQTIADQIAIQYNWCLDNEFNYTPVKMVNNKLLSNEYEIKELVYFINDFENQESEKTQ